MAPAALSMHPFSGAGPSVRKNRMGRREGAKLEIIDSHTHVISADTGRYPPAPLGGHQSDWSKARPVNHDGLAAAMDQAGIAKAVVVQASTVYGHDARYVVEAVHAHPNRFVGVFSIDPLADDAVEQMKRWIGEGLA